MLVNSNYRYGGGGIGSSLIIEGYYNDSKFYQDNSFTTEIDGESGKLYVDLSTNKTYRWTGSIFTAFNADLLDGKHASDFIPISGGTLTGSIITPANDSMGIIPAADNYGQIGSNDKKFFRMYATTFYGSLSGNASTATTATRLSTTAGSAIKPVYFSNGKPTACTYTLEKSVPSNAVFTDTTYSVATSSANGLMSSSDKSKLDGISAGANKTIVDSVLSSTSANPVQNNVITAALASKSDSSHTHSSVNYATSAGNADTVDNLHAWYMATLNADGASHGTSFPMYCKHNVLGDNRFYIGVSGGYERSVAVAFAEKASIAYSTSIATTATTAMTSHILKSFLIGTSNADYATILDWANDKSGFACASIVSGNGIPSDAPTQDEAMLRLESDSYGARKIVTWTKYGGGTPVIYQRAIFNGSWLDAGWERVK